MGLVTRCPACSTTFKFVPDQIRIAAGWVRCGNCGKVFNASAHMLPYDRAPRADKPAEPAPAALEEQPEFVSTELHDVVLEPPASSEPGPESESQPEPEPVLVSAPDPEPIPEALDAFAEGSARALQNGRINLPQPIAPPSERAEPAAGRAAVAPSERVQPLSERIALPSERAALAERAALTERAEPVVARAAAVPPERAPSPPLPPLPPLPPPPSPPSPPSPACVPAWPAVPLTLPVPPAPPLPTSRARPASTSPPCRWPCATTRASPRPRATASSRSPKKWVTRTTRSSRPSSPTAAPPCPTATRPPSPT
jgi:predicted Zn finger-like uncharacterized protein